MAKTNPTRRRGTVRNRDRLAIEIGSEDCLTLREASATLPAQVDTDLTVRTFELRAGTVDEGTRSIGCVIATEQPVMVRDPQTYQVIDEMLRMDGAQFADRVPLLNNHFRWSIDDILGSVRQMKVEGRQFVGRTFFASNDAAADRAWNKAAQGHLTDVSAGYRSIESTDIPAGQTREVKGRSYTAGQRTLRITTRWELREVSLVPVGADADTRLREAAVAPLQLPSSPPASSAVRTTHVNPQLRAFLESLGLRTDADEAVAWTFYRGLTSDNQTRAVAMLGDSQPPASSAPAGPAGNTSPAPTDGPRQQQASPPSPASSATTLSVPATEVERIRAEAITAERTRQARIRELAGTDVPADLVQRAIAENMDEARFAPLFLVAVRDGRSGPAGAPAVHTRGHEQDCTRAALEGAFLVRQGCALDRQAFADPRLRSSQLLPGWLRQDINHADRQRVMELAHRYSGMAMPDLCREAVRLDGGVVTHNHDEMIRAAVSGSSLTAIFSTNINAELLGAYAEAPDSTRGWVAETDVANFLASERASMGKFGAMQKFKRGGEADHLDTSDSKESSKIARYAGQFVCDEMDLIDDRFGAIEQLSPTEMGLIAAALRPDLIYSILHANAALDADSLALFHSTHANIDTNALSAANLEAGIAKMSKQRIKGRPLNVRPRYLLVPHDLRFSADIFLTSAQRFDGTDSGGTTTGGTKNPLSELGIQAVADDRLGVAGCTDPATGTAYAGSATNWYLSGRPGENGVKTLVCKYRRGTGRMPQIRSWVRTQGTWGLGWDVVFDIGADADDYRGLYEGNS